MGKSCKDHCVIDFKNKIVNTYDNKSHFAYNPVECTYLMDVTIINNDEGVGFLAQKFITVILINRLN